MDQETVRFLRSVLDASLLGLRWSDREERMHARSLRVLGSVLGMLPDRVRRFPFDLLLADVDLRRRLGRPLV